MGFWAMLVGSAKVRETSGRADPAACDIVSVDGRRSSVAPGPGRDGGRAPWHGETGPAPGTVAAVSPDGGVWGCGGCRLRSRGAPGVSCRSSVLLAVSTPLCDIFITSLTSLTGGDCGCFSTRRLSSNSRSNCHDTHICNSINTKPR